MAGIIPNPDAGAVIIRDDDGNCATPANVANTWCPPETFTTTCEVAALPDGCASRIQPKQITAIMSELLALGYKLNPNGNWNCGSVLNLSTLFEQWAAGSYGVSMNVRMQTHLCNTTAMNQAQLNILPDATFLMCDGAGHVRNFTGRFFYNAVQIANAFCADDTAMSIFVNCMPDILIADTVAGHRIAVITNMQGTSVDLNETITSLVDNSDGTYTYTNEEGAQTVLTDTNVTDNTLVWDDASGSFVSTVTEDGVDHEATLQLPISTIACGDRAIMRDAVTGSLRQKLVLPPPRYKLSEAVVQSNDIIGPALDAMVGETVVTLSLTIDPFVTVQNCYPQHENISAIRGGSWAFTIATPDDQWRVNFTQTGATLNNGQFNQPQLVFANHFDRSATHNFAQEQGTEPRIVANSTPITQTLQVEFDPVVYTPNVNNRIRGNIHVIRMSRREIVLGA